MTSEECWALLHLVDTKGFSPISFDWGPFNMLRNISVTAKAWILDDICKVFAPIAAPCTAITSPPSVFCIALSIVCLHWMDLCTLVKVICIYFLLSKHTVIFAVFYTKFLCWFCDSSHIWQLPKRFGQCSLHVYIGHNVCCLSDVCTNVYWLSAP